MLALYTRKFYKGAGVYFHLRKPQAVELRWDNAAYQLEATYEWTHDEPRWYFVARVEKHFKDWQFGIQKHFFGVKVCVGPLAIGLPRHQEHSALPDC